MNARVSSHISVASKHSKLIKVAIPVIVIVFAIVITLVVGGTLSHSSNTNEVKVQNAYMQNEKNDGTIDIPGFYKLFFKARSKKQEVGFYNPNANACYFKLTLTMDDGTILWSSSELLEPGEKIVQIKLSHTLKKGDYNATLRYDCFALESKSPLNGAEIDLAINVS